MLHGRVQQRLSQKRRNKGSVKRDSANAIESFVSSVRTSQELILILEANRQVIRCLAEGDCGDGRRMEGWRMMNCFVDTKPSSVPPSCAKLRQPK